jgi:NADH-quinone oxidoreductase subunit H
MSMSFVAVFLYAGSMSTSAIVAAQEPIWYAVILLPSFLIYVTAMVGETNRAPFDLPEAEGELVGGFHTEYSSLKFAMFFLAEYINMVTVSALATTLFLGGWRAPWPISLWESANTGWWPLLWWLIKVQLFIFVFIWLRGTLPRLRYDQFMRFGWKILIPASLVWIVIVAAARVVRNEFSVTTQELLLLGAGALIVIVVGSWVLQIRTARQEKRDLEESAAQAAKPFDPYAGGYPVPPLPGQEFTYTSRRARAGSTLTGTAVTAIGPGGSAEPPLSGYVAEATSDDEQPKEDGNA